MTVRVLGPGCANCMATVTLIEDIARGMDVDVTVAKVEDMAEIMSYGVLSTPGAVIDGTLVHSGGRPSRDKIAGWLGA